MALFKFLAASARARIVRVDFLYLAYLRCLRRGGVAVGSGYLGCRFTLDLLLDTDVEQDADGLLGDCCGHSLKHLVSAHLILDNRISLAVSLQADTLAQLVHIVDVAHPLVVNDLQEYYTLQLTDLLCLLELSLFCLLQLYSLFLQHML